MGVNYPERTFTKTELLKSKGLRGCQRMSQLTE